MAEPRCQSTDTKYQYNELHEIERALSTMRKFGIPEVSEAYQKLYGIRGQLIKQVGFKIPRPMSLLKILLGLSPGTVKVWHDAESGWFSEARTKPGAPPVYKHITDEVAIKLLKGELTKELETTLMTPDDYIGE